MKKVVSSGKYGDTRISVLPTGYNFSHCLHITFALEIELCYCLYSLSFIYSRNVCKDLVKEDTGERRAGGREGLRDVITGNKGIDYENGTWVQLAHDCIQLLT